MEIIYILYFNSIQKNFNHPTRGNFVVVMAVVHKVKRTKYNKHNTTNKSLTLTTVIVTNIEQLWLHHKIVMKITSVWYQSVWRRWRYKMVRMKIFCVEYLFQPVPGSHGSICFGLSGTHGSICFSLYLVHMAVFVSVCVEKMGLENYQVITDNQFTASSSLDHNHNAAMSRLTLDYTSAVAAWRPSWVYLTSAKSKQVDKNADFNKTTQNVWTFSGQTLFCKQRIHR